jgi:ketosteroid isomerase-like protein
VNENDKKKLILDFINALSAGDGALLRSTVTDDIVWSLPGQSRMSGEAHGVDGILARSDTLRRYGVKLEVLHVVYGYRDVSVQLHNTGTRGDTVLDEYLTTVGTLRANKIQRLDTFISDVPMLNTFFPKGGPDV